MHYLIITSNYFPEPTGIALYSTDLAQTLSLEGHEVSVLTTLPHYPWWKVPTEHSSYMPGIKIEDGITVVRYSHYIPTVFNAITRAAYEISIFIKFLFFVFNSKKKSYDFIISYTPTVACALAGKILSAFHRIPLGIVVQDLSGIGAAQSGLKGGEVISKIAERVELQILASADTIVTVSKSMMRYLLKRGIPHDKINLILNYSTNRFTNIPTQEARKKLRLSNSETILLHAGNMGSKQNLGNVIEAARILDEQKNIRILLLGNGNQEESLKSMIEDLRNIEIIPTVNQEMFYFYLGAADILILNERETQTDMSLPSKLTTYFFSEKSILAAVSKVGATAEYLRDKAYVIDPDDPIKFAAAVTHLIENPEQRVELAKRSSNFANQYLLPEAGRAMYLDWIKRSC